MRKKHAAAHENNERWLVSYADFMTLLFAFFVVMFASTQADKSKAKAVSESVREALEHGQFSAAISVVLGRGKLQAKSPAKPERDQNPPSPPPAASPAPHAPADLERSLATLEKALAPEILAGKMQIHLEPRGLVISLREAAFFASAGDSIEPASFPILQRIAAVIGRMPNPIRLEGHTDSVPIHNSMFRSNWELSAARSIAMLELLSRRFEIEAGRLTVAGYADHAPADTNETEIGRAHNRRVDVVILSAEGLKAEPLAAVQTAAKAAANTNAPAAQASTPVPGRAY
jgi:chemotaxis protein MotB